MEFDEQVEMIKDYSYKKMASDKTGHDMSHIERVVKMAKYLAQKEDTDPLVTLAAAYLHDVADDKLVDDPAALEAEIRTFLKTISVEESKIDEILYTTHNLGFSKSLSNNPPHLSSSGQIVQDADRLDAIGAIGITRAIYYGGANQETIYDPKVKPRENMTKKEYRNLGEETIINHFYEKLLKLESMMNTETAKKIAQRRQKYMQDYLSEFKQEWNGEEEI